MNSFYDRVMKREKEMEDEMAAPKKKDIGKLDGGVKYDSGKPRIELIPSMPIRELAKVYTMGAEKYEDDNWRKGMKWGRVYGALQRHLLAFWEGEEQDQESGLSHLAHAMWGCVTLLWYSVYRREFDDRGDLLKGEMDA